MSAKSPPPLENPTWTGINYSNAPLSPIMFLIKETASLSCLQKTLQDLVDENKQVSPKSSGKRLGMGE